VLVAIILAAQLSRASLASGARTLSTGYAAGEFESTNAAEREQWLGRAVRAGGGTVRLAVPWILVAPSTTRPPGFDPSNPSDPRYNWDNLDDAVRAATARGLTVMLNVTLAPLWAEGPNRPSFSEARPGTWKPDPGALGQFARVLALRYRGDFPDPERPGRSLPRVRYYQAWNEPNGRNYLQPQSAGGRPASPGIYRSLLNAFYSGVHSVFGSAKVLTAGTAPYGRRGVNTIRPVRFWRDLFCLRGRRALRKAACPSATRFDIIAHHTVNVFGPEQPAVHPDDATTPDIGRIRRVFNKARAVGRARPNRKKPFWVTEFWWDSRPPDRRGIPLKRHARWLEQSLYLFWKQRVSVGIWFALRDFPSGPSGSRNSSRSGLYFQNGRPKPALRAARFPFVTERLSRNSVRAWGKAPKRGRVRIQRRVGGAWRTIRRVHGRGKNRPFVVVLRLRGAANLRARSRAATSLIWHQSG
jgi:hypothetical protein